MSIVSLSLFRMVNIRRRTLVNPRRRFTARGRGCRTMVVVGVSPLLHPGPRESGS